MGYETVDIKNGAYGIKVEKLPSIMDEAMLSMPNSWNRFTDQKEKGKIGDLYRFFQELKELGINRVRTYIPQYLTNEQRNREVQEEIKGLLSYNAAPHGIQVFYIGKEDTKEPAKEEEKKPQPQPEKLESLVAA